MPDEHDGDRPSDNPEKQSLSELPMSPSAPEQGEVGKRRTTYPNEELSETAKLERDIKIGEIWLIAINVALLLANILIAAIYYGQLHEMRKSTDAMNRALEITERAYLNVGTPAMYIYSATEGAKQDRARVMVPIENSGHIPAKNLTCYVHEARVVNSKIVHSTDVVLCEEGIGIPPGAGHFNIGVPLLNFGLDEMREIKSGRERVRIVGKIRYDDGFGTMDESYFCFSSNPTIPSEWQSCSLTAEDDKQQEEH